MKNIKQQLYELNEGFYKLFARLHSNKNFLVKTEYQEEIAENIMEVYKGEVKMLMLEYKAEKAPILYSLESIAVAMKPRRGLFRRNRAMKVLDEQLGEILEECFEKLASDLNILGLLSEDKTPSAQSEGAEVPAEQSPAEGVSKSMSAQSEAEEQPAERTPEDPLPETSEAPGAQSEAEPTTTPPQPAKKKHKRGNKDMQATVEVPQETSAAAKQSEASEHPTESLQLDEVSIDGGAQIRLQIP